MTLLDYIPTRNPKYSRPFHLARLCDALDKIGTEPLRRIFWHGPRCGLTQTLMAAMTMHGRESFAYAASRPDLTDHVLRRLGRNVHSGASPIMGNSVTGAYLLDGYIPDPEQWDHMLTRVTAKASIFIFAQPYETSGAGGLIVEAQKRGFTAGWA